MTTIRSIIAGSFIIATVSLTGGIVRAEPPSPATFSIVAADPEAGEVGVAVASRFFAVGTVVPWARAGVGAVATQANANTSYGPRGLELLERGIQPQEALDAMLRDDDNIDADGIACYLRLGDELGEELAKRLSRQPYE
jgi:hypothetical protein